MSQNPPSNESERSRKLLWAGVVAVAVLIVGAGIWVWFSSGTDAYLVNGQPFRQWLAQRPDFEIADPLAELGTNAVPHLIAVLRQRSEPAWSYQLKTGIWNRLPRSVQSRYAYLRPIPDWQLRRTALFGIRFFGSEAKAALPEVLRISRTETNTMVRAGGLAAALEIAPESPDTFAAWRDEWVSTKYFSRHDLAVYLQMPKVPIPAAVPYLMEEVRSNGSPVVQVVLEALEGFGDTARPLLPELLARFGTNRNHWLSLFPIVRRLGPGGSAAVPMLTACLEEQGPVNKTLYDAMARRQVVVDQRPGIVVGALRALEAIGPAAAPALPAIAPYLTNSAATIRMLAAVAHIRISGQADEGIPILLAGLDNKLPGVREASLHIEYEGDMNVGASGPEAAVILCGEVGPAAAAALPRLKQRLQDENQWMRVSAAEAIWRISGETTASLPTLIAVLDSSTKLPGRQSMPSADYPLLRAIEIIGKMGPAARSAVPHLERVRTFSMAVRHAVSKAFARIESDGGNLPP